MKQEPVIGQSLHPLNDCVLVELKQSSKNFSKKEGKYDTRTEGIVISVPERTGTTTLGQGYINGEAIKPAFTLPYDLVGKIVHFEEFKEGARIRRNGKIYSFIKIEDIRGYENA